MRRFNFSALQPMAIVQKVEQKGAMDYLREMRESKGESMSEEEFVRYLTHEVDNKTHEDGRIAMVPGKYANSVSPYSKTFLRNIEPGIAAVVLALRKKRYLTYSSCEGHGYSFRRYVGLAFCDLESMAAVADYVVGLNIRGVSLRFYDSVANQKLEMGSGKKFKYVGKTNPSEASDEDREVETRTFNIQFHRSYSEYFFMEIVILEEADFVFGKLFRSAWLCFMKRFFWDDLTKRLSDALESDAFGKYRY